AVEQVVEAVVEPAHHDEHLGLPGHVAELELHGELGGQGGEGGPYLVLAERGGELHPHEEPGSLAVAELLALGDVAPMTGQQARHGGHDTGPVRTGQREDVLGNTHGSLSGEICAADSSRL